jgi:hypothetical protein
MPLIPSKRLASLASLRQTDPAVQAGWQAFDARMRHLAGPRLDELVLVNRDWSAAHARKPSYTYPNFIRRMAEEAMRLAFYHRLTGAPEPAAASRTLLSWVMEVPTWNAQAPKNGWRSDLWTADYAAAVGLAIDQLGSALDEETRRAWLRILLERGVRPVLEEWIDPLHRIHALDTMGHNWWSVCVAGAVTGLFAAREVEPRADELLQLAGDALVGFFTYPGNPLQNKQANFGAQGDFIESVGYLDYSLRNLVFLFDVYREQLGRDLPAEIPVLGKTCDYYLALVQPLKAGVQRINFGDMGSGRDTMGSYEHRPIPVWLWLAGEYAREDLFHLVRRAHPVPDDLWELLFWPDGLTGASFAGAPGDTVFEHIGVAVLRDGYHDAATVLAVKTGEKWNHNQSDAGSFILSSAGVEFLVDPGTTEYASPLHARYFKTSLAHNVTLHAGRGQRDDLDDIGTAFMGRIRNRLFAPGYKYVVADATGPWEGVYRRYHRHFLWIEDFVVVVDDLFGWEPGDWSTLFHFAGEVAVEESGFCLTHQRQSLRAHLVSPRPTGVELVTGYASRLLPNELKHEYEVTEKPYLKVNYPAAGLREKMVTVFELPGGVPKQVEPLAGEGMSGVRVSGPDGVWEIACNHRADGRIMHLNTDLAFSGLRTDAFLLALHRDAQGVLDRAGVHNGSYLREGARVLFSALGKGDSLVEPEHG